MVDAAADPSTRDFNVEIVRGGDVDAETLGSTVSTPPMMAERRVVVVRDVSALRKDSRAMLDNYLKRPAPDLLLLLVAPAGAKVDKGLLNATTAIEFDALSGARIPKWIAYYVEHDLKSSITDGAITLLQEAAGTDLQQLKIELDKLASYMGGDAINEAAVSAVVGVRPGETMGNFLDAVARRDPRAAQGECRHDGDGVDGADPGHGLGAGGARARNERFATQFRAVRATQGVGLRVHRALVGRVRIDVRARVGRLVRTGDRRCARHAARGRHRPQGSTAVIG
jgi:hypothetical protein